MKMEIPNRKIEVPKGVRNRGELARISLAAEANRLRDKHNLTYQMFVGGLDNNVTSKELYQCLKTAETWMLEEPLNSGLIGVVFYDASTEEGIGKRGREMGTRVIEYFTRTLSGWNEIGYNQLPEGCENLADDIGKHYLKTIDGAIKKFQRFQNGEYLDTCGWLRDINDPEKKGSLRD